MDPKELRGLMEAYSEVYAPIDEAVRGESSERRRDLAAQRRAGDKPLSPAKGRDNANKMQRDINYFDKLTKKNKNVVGLVSNEEVDLFDTVLEFLQVEGYAETLEEAEWLMANVIDEEAIEIILDEGKSSRPRYPGGRGVLGQERRDEKREASAENMRGHTEGPGTVTKNPKKLRKQKAMGELGEAQEARNNPEKYEREQSKKSAPVRGERTPMPPRGDKRREDFEKWYAANVR